MGRGLACLAQQRGLTSFLLVLEQRVATLGWIEVYRFSPTEGAYSLSSGAKEGPAENEARRKPVEMIH
jgi:hypothetical protein